MKQWFPWLPCIAWFLLLNLYCREYIPLIVELYYRSENNFIYCLIEQYPFSFINHPFLFIWCPNGCSFWSWTCVVSSSTALDKVISHYKESTAHLFPVWTAKITLFSKAPLCRKQEPSFFCVFPWHLCILPFLNFFLQFFSPPTQVLLSSLYLYFCSFSFRDRFFPKPKISVVLISTASSFPLH